MRRLSDSRSIKKKETKREKSFATRSSFETKAHNQSHRSKVVPRQREPTAPPQLERDDVFGSRRQPPRRRVRQMKNRRIKVFCFAKKRATSFGSARNYTRAGRLGTSRVKYSLHRISSELGCASLNRASKKQKNPEASSRTKKTLARKEPGVEGARGGRRERIWRMNPKSGQFKRILGVLGVSGGKVPSVRRLQERLLRANDDTMAADEKFAPRII